MKGTTSKIKFNSSFINPFSFLVSCLVFSFKSLFLIFDFPDFKLCFCSDSMFLAQKTQVEKTQILVKSGVATKRFFFNEPVFCKL